MDWPRRSLFVEGLGLTFRGLCCAACPGALGFAMEAVAVAQVLFEAPQCIDDGVRWADQFVARGGNL